MERREFLGASAAALAGLAVSPLARADNASPSGARQLYELRTYHFESEDQLKAFDEFLKAALIPALNRLSIQPVGVFRLFENDNRNKAPLTPDELQQLFVLLPHDSWDSVLHLEQRLADDGELAKTVTPPDTAKPFVRYESMLLEAMENFPRLVKPKATPNRLLQLRTYESPNPERARNKLEMFNKGEFGVFQRAGMAGVFFGGAIVGQFMPQLTYMVAHEDDKNVDKAWDAFRADDDWKKLSGDPSYKGNVSKIHNLLTRPTPASQI